MVTAVEEAPITSAGHLQQVLGVVLTLLHHCLKQFREVQSWKGDFGVGVGLGAEWERDKHSRIDGGHLKQSQI